MLGYVSQLQDEGVDGKDIEAAQMRLDKEKIVNLPDGRTSLFQCAKQTIIINTADTDILRQHGVSRWTINTKVADGLMVWEGNKGVQLKRLIASKYKTDLGKQQVVRLADWDYRFNRMQVGTKRKTAEDEQERKLIYEENHQSSQQNHCTSTNATRRGYVAQLQEEGIDEKQMEAAQMRLDTEKIVLLPDGRTSLFQSATQSIVAVVGTADVDLLKKYGLSRWRYNPKHADGLFVWEGRDKVQLKRLIAQKYKGDFGKQQVVRKYEWDYRFQNLRVGAETSTERLAKKRKATEDEKAKRWEQSMRQRLEVAKLQGGSGQFLYDLYVESKEQELKQLTQNVLDILMHKLTHFGDGSDYYKTFLCQAFNGQCDRMRLTHAHRCLSSILVQLQDSLELEDAIKQPNNTETIGSLKKFTMCLKFNNHNLFKEPLEWNEDEISYHDPCS